jgi:hypothetical protein
MFFSPLLVSWITLFADLIALRISQYGAVTAVIPDGCAAAVRKPAGLGMVQVGIHPAGLPRLHCKTGEVVNMVLIIA